MKNFLNFYQFSIITIEENLKIADYCICTYKKNNNNAVYGMPALILLSSSIDIIGTILYHGISKSFNKDDLKSKRLGRCKEHFQVFGEKFIANERERQLFVDIFYPYARCNSIHNGILGNDIKITINECNSNVFISEKRIQRNKKVYTIYIKQLYDLIYNAFDSLRTDLIKFDTGENFQPTTGSTQSVIS